MFENFIKWADENKIYDLWDDPDLLPTKRHLETYYPSGYYCCDRLGRPVHIEKWSGIKFRKVLEVLFYFRLKTIVPNG